MALSSMTGFAESIGSHDGMRWRWEAKSVNGRGLDLRLRTPPGYDGLEAPARRLATARFARGSLQVSLTVENQDTGRGLKIDAAALAAAVKLAREIASETGLAPARVDGILALKGVIVQEETTPLDTVARAHVDAAILESLAQALDKLAKERANEGAKLATLFSAQLDEIARLTAEAEALASAQPAALRARLMAQITDLLAGSNVSEDRLAQEAALLAAKADVREELDRLTAHLQDARALIAGTQAAGASSISSPRNSTAKPNTLCSKSADIALTRTGLALKAVIDQFREQSQNVE